VTPFEGSVSRVATSTTREEVQLRHPYKVPGVILVIASLILIAYDLGTLEACGGGRGVCVDFTTHRVGTAALIVFFILFIIGVIMIIYTGASSTVTTQATRAPDPPASVTIVNPGPPSPPPQSTNVNVNPPRSGA
jgi:hypothetical protein